MAALQEPTKRTWMRVWSTTAWWIVVLYSIPFALYTLPFIYGDYEIYKWCTIAAARGVMEGAGEYIRNNLRIWQVHAFAALLFVAIGPFQFNTGFRNKHPVLHKRMGYAFAVCTVVTSVSGGLFMPKVSELGPIALGLSPFMAVGSLLALGIAIVDARNKRFQSHRRWMMRSAAIGYVTHALTDCSSVLNKFTGAISFAFYSKMQPGHSAHYC